MTFKELKDNLLKGFVPTDLLIFVCKDNHFLADQYLNEICIKAGKEANTVKSIFEPTNSALALVFDYSSAINVVRTEVFEEVAEDYSIFENTIVICDKVDKKILPLVEDYIIELPKPTEGHFKAYMQVICPELLPTDINWLYKAANGDIYKIKNELDKVNLFYGKTKKEILNELRFNTSSDLYSATIFDLLEFVAMNNRVEIMEFFKHREACDFDPIAFTNLLLKKFKEILLIKHRSNVNLKLLGITDWQAKKIRENYPYYPEDYLFSVIKFLSGIDQDLKLGRLDLPKAQLLDYIILNVVR